MPRLTIADKLREFGLKYPGAHLKCPWPDHKDLAVNNKTFAYLSVTQRPFKISCKLPQSSEQALDLTFVVPTGYGLGKAGWVTATLEKASDAPIELFQSWIEESYRAQAPKKLVRELDARLGTAPRTEAKGATVAKGAPGAKGAPAVNAPKAGVPAGYSGTPLPKKLGIKAEQRVALLGAPAGFDVTLGPLPEGVTVATSLRGKLPFDVVVYFVSSQAELARRFSGLAARLQPAGGLWVAWPKKASGVPSTVTEDTVRAVALPLGLVDNKVCAIDPTWSGLRCVLRKENRPAR